jgi:hypothetical protein
MADQTAAELFHCSSNDPAGPKMKLRRIWTRSGRSGALEAWGGGTGGMGLPAGAATGGLY